MPLPLPRIRAMDMLTAQSQQRGDLVLIASYRPGVEHNNRLHATITWQPATPQPFPVVDVVSDIELPDLQRNPEAMARISVQVSSGDTGTSLPEAIEVRIFPRVFAPGQNHTINSPLARDDTRSASSLWISQVYEVPALDGHVLVRLAASNSRR